MALNNELNILISQLQRAGVPTAEFERKLALAADNQEEIIRLTREMQTALSNVEGTATNLYARLKEITSEMLRGKAATNQAAGAYSKLTQLAQQLSDDEAGITDINKAQTTRLLEKAKIQQKLLSDLGRTREIQELLLANDEDLTEKQLAIKKAYEDQNEEANRVVKLAENRLELERSISKQMGVTGAVVGGTGALMERLGMRSGIFQDAVQDAQTSMRVVAKRAALAGKEASKLSIAMIGASKLAKGFGQALTDPAVIITAIVNKAFELNAASVKLQQLTGEVADRQAAVNTSLASGAQVLNVMAELTERTGVAASAIFSSEDLARLAEAKNLLGLSSEQAANLGMMSKVAGTSIQGYKEGIVASVNEFNTMNDSAIAHGVIIKDVLSTSADISISLGGNEAKISAAAAAARKLGVDLAKVNQIADGLLNFEDSISKELEAQLLTGKNINLSKARELALNNDLEGVANELAKNGASAEEFANMNRIQQQAIADSMGMTREEMGKMLINQKGMNNLSDEQRAKMRGVTLEQLEQMEASESLKLAFSKLAEPLAAVLSSLAPILTGLAKVIALVTPIAGPIFLVVQAFKLYNSGILGSIKNMGKLLTKTALLGKFYKGGQFMPGGGRAAAGGQRAGGLFSKVKSNAKAGGQKAGGLFSKVKSNVKKVKNATQDAPKGKQKGFLQGLGDGLASIGKQAGDVIKGALALGVAGLALGGSFALALRMVKDVKPATMLAFASSLSILGLTVAALGKVGGSIIKGALAIGILSASLIPAAFAFSLLEGIKPAQMFAFAGALTLLGVAAAGLGFLFPFIAAGAGAIALLGAALIPAALAFQLLGNTPIETIIGKLTGLATIAPQLLMVGAGLMSIAAGLGAISLAGTAAIPALLALSAFSLAVTPLASLFAGGEGGAGGGSSMKNVEDKLDTLIAAVNTQRDIKLDGTKVGETLAIGNFAQ